MKAHMTSILRPAIVLFAALSVLCGVLYPLAITAIGQLAFATQVQGSILMRDGKPVGSTLIGQAFSSPGYFWSRPSATTPMPNNALASGGANLGPTNPALIDAVKARTDVLRAADPGNAAPIPVDLVSASASGLDPDISLAGAYYQAARVARVRKLRVEQVRAVIDGLAQQPRFGFLGEARVNVLLLNLELDRMR